MPEDAYKMYHGGPRFCSTYCPFLLGLVPVSARLMPVSARPSDMLFSILSSLNLVRETISKYALKHMIKHGAKGLGGNFCAAPIYYGVQGGGKVRLTFSKFYFKHNLIERYREGSILPYM